MSPLHRAVRRAAAGALLLALGCDASSVTRASDDVITVRSSSQELVYHNQSEWPVWVFAIESDALAYVDFIPCTDATRCASIAPGAERRDALANVIGYAPGREVRVIYRELVPESAGPARARTGIVTVRP
jgi:hypothetical protein